MFNNPQAALATQRSDPPPQQRRVLIVTDAMVEEALGVLASEDVAITRGDYVKSEAMLKHEKAVAVVMSAAKSAAMAEREAEASDRYLAAIERYRDATVAYEVARARREWASMAIEVWRTQQANRRAPSI